MHNLKGEVWTPDAGLNAAAVFNAEQGMHTPHGRKMGTLNGIIYRTGLMLWLTDCAGSFGSSCVLLGIFVGQALNTTSCLACVVTLLFSLQG